MNKLSLITLILLVAVFATSASGRSLVLTDVVGYNWHRGCAPTAAGMLFGYHDGRGYEDLFPGSADTLTDAVKKRIASNEHYNDYSLPIDSEGAIQSDKSETDPTGCHEDNSIADFMLTSRSSENIWYGGTWVKDIDDGMEDYAAWCGYDSNAWNETWGSFIFDDLVNEIENNRPMVLHVDSDADGDVDHAVCAIGYNDETNQYACYNTNDANIHWYDFTAVANGQSNGVDGATFFVMITEPIPEPSTIAMIIGALGIGIPFVRRAGRR